MDPLALRSAFGIGVHLTSASYAYTRFVMPLFTSVGKIFIILFSRNLLVIPNILDHIFIYCYFCLWTVQTVVRLVDMECDA